MLTTEIVDIIIKNDNRLVKNAYDRKVCLCSLSVALRRSVKQGALRKGAKLGLRTCYYGLPEWFDENGIIKREYDVDYFND